MQPLICPRHSHWSGYIRPKGRLPTQCRMAGHRCFLYASNSAFCEAEIPSSMMMAYQGIFCYLFTYTAYTAYNLYPYWPAQKEVNPAILPSKWIQDIYSNNHLPRPVLWETMKQEREPTFEGRWLRLCVFFPPWSHRHERRIAASMQHMWSKTCGK